MLAEKFSNCLQTNDLGQGRIYLLGLSGGLDSVVLAHLCREYQQGRGEGSKFYCLHLNHCLRGKESWRDQEFSKKLAAQFGFDFIEKKVEVRKYCRSRGLSLEEGARQVRYDFFAESAQKIGTDKLLLAHHADDQAETVLMNMSRGCGILGLGAMPEVYCRQGLLIVRPLLSFFRSDLEAFAQKKGFFFCQDSSNRELKYKRNQIRLQFLPGLAEEMPEIKSLLLCMGGLARRFYCFMESKITNVLPEVLIEMSREMRFSLPALKSLNLQLRTELIRHCLKKYGQGFEAKCISKRGLLLRKNSTQIEYLLQGGKSGNSIMLPGNLKMMLNYDELCVRVEKEAKGESGKIVIDDNLPMKKKLGDFVFTLSFVSRREAEEKMSAEVWHEVIDGEKITFPLTIRQPETGDKFMPLGLKGHMLVSDFFTNKKIDRRARERAVIVEDQNKIIWLCPYRVSEEVKLDKFSKKFLLIRCYHNCK